MAERKRYLLPTETRIGNNSYAAGYAFLTDEEARQAGLEVSQGEQPAKDQSKYGTSQSLPGGSQGPAVAETLSKASGDQAGAQASGTSQQAGNAGGDTGGESGGPKSGSKSGSTR
jgi:hypothetical protein